MQPDAARIPTWPSASISWPRKATARSSAAASASTTWPFSSSGSGSTTCRARPTSGTSTCASTGACPHSGLRPGRRADGVLDLRHQAHPRDHPLPAAPLQDLSLTRPPRGAPGVRRARKNGRPDQPRLRQEPRRQRGHARAACKRAGYGFVRATRGRRRRHRQHLRLHPAGARRGRDDAPEASSGSRRGDPAQEDRRRRLLRREGPGRPPSATFPGRRRLDSASGASTRSSPSSRACRSRGAGRDVPL